MKSVIITLASLLLAAVSLIGYPAQAQVQKAEGADVTIALADPQVAQQDTSRPPAEFVEVDKEPSVLSRKDPVYPEVAKKAGIEGKVWAKIWIDKQGMPREVHILKSDNEIFNKSVLDAAYGFRFNPALIKEKPVDVWVSVPFMFKLAEKMGSAEKKTYDHLSEFVRDLLNGKSIDSARIRAAVNPTTYAVIGGEHVYLIDAIRRQVSGDRIIEPANRKIQHTAYELDDRHDAAFMTVSTEGQGKKAKVRYHTIIFFSNEKGDWMIRGWHVSQ
jgi:TonB family protein